MQLMPKRVKFRKAQRGRMKGEATRGNTVRFGDFGLMSLEMAWISARQIEAARMCAAHALGTGGRLYMRVFPHKPISAKPAETRMGKGKGEPEYYAAVVHKGTILVEISGVPEEVARQILNLVAHKMPIRVRMVARRPAL
jgi:large subunit ribosomal protein L16